MSNIVLSQAKRLAESFGIEGDAQEIVSVLKATAFRSDKGEVSDAQLAALLIVAGQYGLNPWTKEIYAFPDKKNGIVPVVGVDGWSLDHWDMRTGRNGIDAVPCWVRSLDHWDMRTGRN